MDSRAYEILSHVINVYCETGEPVGSQTLSQQLSQPLSPATIRHVMSALEESGLLYSPHPSAGRLPTEAGLRFFVNQLLETDHPVKGLDESMEPAYQTTNRSVLMEKTATTLSNLSKCASLMFAPKTEAKLKHIEFVDLEPGRVLAVLVTANGAVENRLIKLPKGITKSDLIQAGNYLTDRLSVLSLKEAREIILEELSCERSQLSELSRKVVEAGLNVWQEEVIPDSLIIRGQSNLLRQITKLEDLERLQNLLGELESKESLLRLLDAVIKADGVQIYIGADSPMKIADSSIIVAPYHNAQKQLMGVIGVIGPTWIPYARVIPMVRHTAKLMAKMYE